LLAQRIPLYEKAAAVAIDPAGKSALQIADEIYDKLPKVGLLTP
jgi:hypothetical protein